MWDEFESDTSDSSDLEGTGSPDYGDTSDGFDEIIDDATIGFGEMGDTSLDTETPLEEDDLGSTDSLLDSDDTDTGSTSIGIDQTGDISDGFDTPFDEDEIEDIDSISASSSIDESSDPFEEDEVSDTLEGEDSMMEGPVLRRDPDEIADIQERTWLQRADILRDDLRDKGWEDGPQMEEYVASQMDQWRTEADQTNQTYFGTPDTTPQDEQLEEDVIPDAISEDDDSSGTIEGMPSTASQLSDTDEPEPFEEDGIPDTTTSGSEGEILDQASSDSTTPQSIDDTQPLADDQTGEDESEYPSGFDYSKVDWDQVYSDIEAEQTADSIQDSASENSTISNVSSVEHPADSVDNEIESDAGESDIGEEQEQFLDQIIPVPSSYTATPDTTETEPVSDSGDIQSISDVSNWIGEINPNFDEFDPESPYCNNCGSCAYAVYQRLEGNTESCASAENIGYNSEMNALTGMEQVSMSPEEIEQRLLNQGDGAHAIIGIDRAEGPGHWFNAACLNGRVVAIDGQTGEITDWPPDYGDVVNWEMSVSKEA